VRSPILHTTGPPVPKLDFVDVKPSTACCASLQNFVIFLFKSQRSMSRGRSRESSTECCFTSAQNNASIRASSPVDTLRIATPPCRPPMPQNSIVHIRSNRAHCVATSRHLQPGDIIKCAVHVADSQSLTILYKLITHPIADDHALTTS